MADILILVSSSWWLRAMLKHNYKHLTFRDRNKREPMLIQQL